VAGVGPRGAGLEQACADEGGVPRVTGTPARGVTNLTAWRPWRSHDYGISTEAGATDGKPPMHSYTKSGPPGPAAPGGAAGALAADIPSGSGPGAGGAPVRRTPAPEGSEARLRRALARSDAFGGLPAAAAEVLVARGRVARLDAGQVLYRRGDPGGSVMMVVTGRVRISNSVPGGKEAVIGYVDPGDIFGELAVFDGGPRSVDASANVRSEVFVLGRRELLSVLGTYPAAMLPLVTLMCERTRRLAAMLEDAMFLDTDQRVAKALLRLAEEHGTAGPGGVLIDVRLNETELGFHVGVCREGVNRCVRAWRRAGIVGRERGRITVREPRRLRAIAGAGEPAARGAR
jgi:CRP/FNR family cyclic AMP-dependent transcriptional regulator